MPSRVFYPVPVSLCLGFLYCLVTSWILKVNYSSAFLHPSSNSYFSSSTSFSTRKTFSQTINVTQKIYTSSSSSNSNSNFQRNFRKLNTFQLNFQKNNLIFDNFDHNVKKDCNLPSTVDSTLLLLRSNSNNDYNYINSYEDCSSYTYSRVNQIARSMRLKSKPNGLIFRPSEEKGAFDKDKIGMPRIHRFIDPIAEESGENKSKWYMWYQGRNFEEMDESLPPISTGNIGYGMYFFFFF